MFIQPAVQTAERNRFPEFFGALDYLNPEQEAENAFMVAWRFLENHSLFKVNGESTFKKCMTITLVPAFLVTDQISPTDPEHSHQTGVYIQIETGPVIKADTWNNRTGVFEKCYLSTLDPRLTGTARTFKMAVREVASNVLMRYGAK